MALEIEKKYRLSGPLPYSLIESAHMYRISQYYTEIEKESEIRYRLVKTTEGARALKTVKTGSGLVRTEEEIEIPLSEYHHNIKNIRGICIKKTRYVLPLERPIVAEYDCYITPSNLYIVEVEFPDENEAVMEEMEKNLSNMLSDTGITWQDVTEDKTYKNKNIALRG